MSYTTILEKEVREAYIFLREKNNTIPSETLDFMLDASLEKIKDLEKIDSIKELAKSQNDDIEIGEDFLEIHRLLLENFHTSNAQFVKMANEIIKLRGYGNEFKGTKDLESLISKDC
jgi:hypothetical protein